MLGLSGIGFLVLETFIFHRIFNFLFHGLDPSLEPVSRALSLTLLQTLFFVFGLMLVYSNLVTSISVYLTANDMKLLLVVPVRNRSLYLYKFAETLSRSSLTLAVFMIPALVTYAEARGSGPEFYFWLPVLILFFLILPAALAVPAALLLARVFPAKRLQQGLLALGLVATTAGLFAFRMMKVEEVFTVTGNLQQMLNWADTFQLPKSGWLPSSWMVEAFDRLVIVGTPGMAGLKLALAACAALLFSWALGTPLLGTAWSRAFGKPRKDLGRTRWFQFGAGFPGLSREDSAMVLKEAKVFVRDLSRWSQLVMMVPLIGFYLLNMYMLPFPEQFSALYYLLNLFMIAFIVSAIGARYLFPSISWEGPALWLIRVSPYPVWRLVAIKFVLFTLPLALLSSVLVIFSSRLFEFTPEVIRVSLVLTLATTGFLSALAVGFGALFPKFRYEHHLEISLGPGGLIYMLTAFAVCFLFMLFLGFPIFAEMGERAFRWEQWSFSDLEIPNMGQRWVWILFCGSGSLLSLTLGILSLSRRESFDR
jgi:ABC-2 type transport system permease protein